MIKLFKGKFNRFFMLFFTVLGIAIPTKGWSSDQTLSTKPSSIVVAAKPFNVADCRKYLGRNILATGYQPVQIIIKNTSDKNIIFSPNQISLPCEKIEQITGKVHSSTVGRTVGYGAASLFVSRLFVIPAIVDGVKSSNANKTLDADYFNKTAREQTLTPNSKLNGLIFVPSDSYAHDFSITLIEEDSNKAHKIPATIYWS